MRAGRHAMVVPRLSASQVEPSSPQPSVDRLSVTFAIDERNGEDNAAESSSQPPPSSDFDFNHHHPPRRRATLDAALIKRPSPDMQRLHSYHGSEEAGGEEDDYSASACAIIQRRNSSRRHSRRKRRPSSPFSPDAETALRRRSSVFTTSSGDTAISMEDAGATNLIEDQIFENVKLHKEVLHGVKQQPWPLRKKLKLVRQAKAYVSKHEGKLQERLAQTRSTRDAIARASILLNKKWQYFKRELINFKTVLVPWERRIKQIESQFGSAVASYFIFLRWLFWVNIVISVVLMTFVAIPELLATVQNATDDAGERKTMLPEEQVKANHFLTLWEFEGNLKYSPFFYGWYSNKHTYKAYKLPLAYFVVNLVVYTYSFVAILRKMAENSRMSKLSEKEDECVFSWKLFTGWDFMIGNDETAHNRIGSIVLGLKEALLEESEKHRDERNWKVISIRIFVNLLVIAMLVLSAWAVVEVVDRSEDVRAANSSWWRQNEITIVMTLITYSFPFVFEVLGIIESYHPRKQLRLQLGRIMILNLLNMYSLIYALFKKINSSDEKLQSLKPKESITKFMCFNVPVSCGEPSTLQTVLSLTAMSLIISSNFSTNNAAKIFHSPPQLLTAAETTKYTLLMDNNIFNASQDQIPLGPFDVNSIFSDWSIFREEDRNDTIDPFMFEMNNFTESTISFSSPSNSLSTDFMDNSRTTATVDSMDNLSITTSTDNSINSDDVPSVWNPVTQIDDNDIVIEGIPNIDDNDIGVHVVNDDYPHENFGDYGFLELDYNETSDVPGVQSLNTEKITDPTSPSTPYTVNANSCQGVGKIVGCYQRICENRTIKLDNVSVSTKTLDLKTRRLLRGLCWETMFGQEIAKLTMMDLAITILSTMAIDFFRALFVRYVNSCWCWDLEKKFPQYGDFKIAENILHLVNNQGMVWMGSFFSPGLIVLNVIKLVILMYLRSWTVLTCNVPHEIVFRASRSNNFYLALLLTMLFLCVLPVGYAIVWVEPSWHCGPFSGNERIYYLATRSLKNALPKYVHDYKVLEYIASPGIVIPLIVLMTLIIYYMVSLTNSLRESNNDLKVQLRQERTEERRKMFKIAERRLENDTPFARWKKILPASKSVDAATNKGNVSYKDLILTNRVAMEEKVQKRRSAGSENSDVTEGEQESLPNDQVPTSSKNVDNEVAAVINDHRKNSWRATRLKEKSESPVESIEGVSTGAIPKIQISLEETNGEKVELDIEDIIRRLSTNSDEHL
ncbi:transmembrane channel-like protein [Phymastichus coffea]|uniref:transmembrane channel-like protein n=1 Tax=Phymastichus coffea TaxID=108790 RepID=UPI00273C6DA9|nr:transmembrane channel-like protein [Phymastichus coffea]